MAPLRERVITDHVSIRLLREQLRTTSLHHQRALDRLPVIECGLYGSAIVRRHKSLTALNILSRILLTHVQCIIVEALASALLQSRWVLMPVVVVRVFLNRNFNRSLVDFAQTIADHRAVDTAGQCGGVAL